MDSSSLVLYGPIWRLKKAAGAHARLQNEAREQGACSVLLGTYLSTPESGLDGRLPGPKQPSALPRLLLSAMARLMRPCGFCLRLSEARLREANESELSEPEVKQANIGGLIHHKHYIP